MGRLLFKYTQETTLYATYSVNTYTVTFKDWDGSTLKTQTVNYQSNATPPANPTRTGYVFNTWSGTYTNVTSNQTITATYVQQSYKVEFRDINGDLIDTQYIYHGLSATAPENPTRTGYTFTGWDGSYSNIHKKLRFMQHIL